MTEQGPPRTGGGTTRSGGGRPKGAVAARRRPVGTAPVGEAPVRARRRGDTGGDAPRPAGGPGWASRLRGGGRDRAAVERGAGGRWPVPERSVLATVLGVSPLLAVAAAAGATTLGVFLDLLRIGALGPVFAVCYVGGCLSAVAWVRRRSLFGPVVAPPLLLAGAVPVVVLLAGSPRPGTGISERMLTIGAPLVNSFPTMASTTAAVLAVGAGRWLAQRAGAGGGQPVSAPSGRDAARGAARTSASPERS